MSRSALYILTTVLLASACNKAVMEYSNMGSISLSLASDVEVVVTTKADTEVDYDSFLINVSGQTFIGNQYSEDYIYGHMPERSSSWERGLSLCIMPKMLL